MKNRTTPLLPAILYRRGKRTLLAALCVVGAGLASAHGATVVFHDNFSGYEGLQTESSMGAWTLSGNGKQPDSNSRISVLKDTGNRFGAGTENHYLSFSTTATGSMALRAVDQFHGNSLITLSFSIIVPDSTGPRPIDIRSGTDIMASGNISHRAIIEANSISGASLNYNTPQRVDIVINSGATDIANYDGEHTLTSKSFDVWVDGVLLAPGVTGRLAGLMDDITSISFQALSMSTNPTAAEFYLDWVTVYDGVGIMQPIPEPTAALLLLPTVSMIYLWSRRSKSQ